MGEGDRETDKRVLNERSTLLPFFKTIAVVAFSESDSTISPSDGGDKQGEDIISRSQESPEQSLSVIDLIVD